MKISSVWVLSLGLIPLFTGGPAKSQPASTGSTVSANVGKLRAVKGNVTCRLFFLEKSFPRGKEGTVRKSVPISGNFARCTFKGVPPGTYAMTVFHDENDNGKVDKNLIGMPTEGYGVSNNRTYAMAAPVWSECKFVVEAGKNRDLAIGLRY